MLVSVPIYTRRPHRGMVSPWICFSLFCVWFGSLLFKLGFGVFAIERSRTLLPLKGLRVLNKSEVNPHRRSLSCLAEEPSTPVSVCVDFCGDSTARPRAYGASPLP